MSTDSHSGAAAAGRYTIRAFEQADIEGFLRLDRLVWDRTRSPEWFRWKYVDNPVADHTPIIVAEHDGEIVGVRPFLAFELRLGGETVTAYQPADTMVHPDHRREGIFHRMTTHALSAYRDGEPALFFNFPNEYARPGYLDLGWRAVAPERTYYRVETPAAIPTGSEVPQVAFGALRLFLKGYYAARRELSKGSEGLTVQETEGVPLDRLARLHDRRRPPTIHANRTEEFLDWRLSSPVWERRSYVVEPTEGADEPIAALVARSRTTSSGFRLTQVVDVAPLCGGTRWQGALQRGLRAVVSSHPSTDLFAVSDGAIPHRVLTAVGFLPDDSLPLSRFRSYDSMLVTRPNGDPETEAAWQVGGRAIDDPDNWCVTFVERDTT
ncbi:GNAT family N-acetyltransferase [Halohasta litorea]|uniref:GNAT family N-acetyltransferase n=1 Tax=Halohasta litorea TaxID=869891 RepID=A0ABD6D9G7_9EURY|nr:GNAT family N-acetyltransferase [Halohasta litorea]